MSTSRRIFFIDVAGFDTGEEGLPDMHRKVEFPNPITVSESGYIYIWVSNESENTAVWPACRSLGEGTVR